MGNEIGSRIRKYREECNLNQKQLGELIGVSNSRVSNWEQGLNKPDADLIVKICKALEVSPSELLDVKLSSEELTLQERNVIQAYRMKTDLQHAINILLDIE